MRAGDWPNAAANARASLPAAQPSLAPEDAGEVLRVAVAQAMARQDGYNRGLVRTYGAAMRKSAYAEAFKVVTDSAIPSNASLQAAVKIATGGSPYDGLMRRLRDRLNRIEAPTIVESTQAARASGPTDGNPSGGLTTALLSVLPKALQPEGTAEKEAPLLPDVRPSLSPQRSPALKVAQNQAKASARPASRRGVDAPRDPAPAPVVGR